MDRDSPEGRIICDLVAPREEIDDGLEKVASKLTNSGVVSAASNHRAFRVAQEPLDNFRQYLAVYATEQAYCQFSPALMSNLEQFWDAKNRRAWPTTVKCIGLHGCWLPRCAQHRLTVDRPQLSSQSRSRTRPGPRQPPTQIEALQFL